MIKHIVSGMAHGKLYVRFWEGNLKIICLCSDMFAYAESKSNNPCSMSDCTSMLATSEVVRVKLLS